MELEGIHGKPNLRDPLSPPILEAGPNGSNPKAKSDTFHFFGWGENYAKPKRPRVLGCSLCQVVSHLGYNLLMSEFGRL